MTEDQKLKDRIRHDRYYKKNKDRILARGREKYAALRDSLYTRYGNRCACCGTATFEFLSIDHKYNDGKKHRELLSKKTTGSYSYLVAIRDDPNPDRFQLLCFNCNCAKGLRGFCPHWNDEFCDVDDIFD